MKLWRTTILLSLGLALAACGNQQPKKATSTSSHVKVAASRSRRKTGVKLSWNQTKDEKLAAFMKDFGPTKDQIFTKAGRNSHEKWQGIDLSRVYQTKQPITIDDKQTAVTWLPKKGHASKTRQNVVAVYVDDQDTVLFLFTLTAAHQPRVLISQVAPKGQVISTVDTTNVNVKQGFAAIAAGKPATLTSKAIAAAKRQAAASSSKAAGAGQHAVVFPASFRHLWYSADRYADSPLTFGANSITQSGSTYPVYDAEEHSARDQAVLNGDDSKMDQAHSNWGSAGTADVGGDHWINVRGWYQTAGDGTSYTIINRSLNGKTVPVLEEGSGAGFWLDCNYFPTQALAQQYQDTVFPDERQND